MEERLQKIEEELQTIKARNARVETDKAWETSAIRTTILAVITFCVTAIALFIVKNENAMRDALIATVGFVFSTLSLSFVKRRWMQR
ncbi:hypothetical protein HY969_04445 [Candidatus Kaiserbacteria bacterium]|nr:hypothetical protein [Candidatus Kaiserbacteria bacterium]